MGTLRVPLGSTRQEIDDDLRIFGVAFWREDERGIERIPPQDINMADGTITTYTATRAELKERFPGVKLP